MIFLANENFNHIKQGLIEKKNNQGPIFRRYLSVIFEIYFILKIKKFEINFNIESSEVVSISIEII